MPRSPEALRRAVIARRVLPGPVHEALERKLHPLVNNYPLKEPYTIGIGALMLNST